MEKDELLSILRTFENDFDKLNDALIDEILKYVNKGMNPAAAADKVLKEESYFGLLLPLMLSCIVSSVFAGAGIKNSVPKQKKEIEQIIKNRSWSSDGVNLAARFKSMRQTMKEVARDSLSVSQRQIKRMKENISDLLGYFKEKQTGDGQQPEEIKLKTPTTVAETINQLKSNEKIPPTKEPLYQAMSEEEPVSIQKQQPQGQPYNGLPARKVLDDTLPQYLKRLEQAARQLAAGDKDLLKGYQSLLRKAEREIKKFDERYKKGKTPNRNLRGEYNNVIRACEKLAKQTDKFANEALQRSIEYAIKERMKYYASRIARTESAAAWFEGFVAKYQDDPDVVAYRWQLSSRHHLVPYDQCDVCANMDVGYGKGIYPKKMLPSIPRHPHCMCMLVPVRAGDISENLVFDAEKTRKYLDSLTDEQKKALFGIDGAEKYRKGGDWQELLRGWDGFVDPTSRFENIKLQQSQEIKISKKDVQNAFSVKRDLVNSKEYHDKFESLDLPKAVKEHLYQVSKMILEKRDGTCFEDLHVLDAKTGSVIAKSDSNSDRKTGLSASEYNKVNAHEGDFVLVHNHPEGGRLSGTDIISAFKNPNVVASIAVGHDGNIHYINRLRRKINLEEYYSEWYNKYRQEGFPNSVARKKATDELYQLEEFEYGKR